MTYTPPIEMTDAKYPDDDLVSSVEYELNELSKYSKKIEEIINSK